jgi:hypothetical protein
VAVEDNSCAGEEAEKRDAGRELVDEEDIIGRCPGREQTRDKVQLASMGKENMQRACERAWERRGEVMDAETTVDGFLKGMGRIVVRGVDVDIMAFVLEPEGGIDDEALSAA